MTTVCVLAGGVGGARFLRGLVRAVDPADVTVVANVGDDLTVHGLRVCPDLDTITYTLAGVVHPSQQWGRADETHVVADELARFSGPGWFTLGDRDLALCLQRTADLADGEALSTVTAGITAAWGLDVRLLPASNDVAETRILTADGRDLHFQEWWVRERAEPEVASVRLGCGADHEPSVALRRPVSGCSAAPRTIATALADGRVTGGSATAAGGHGVGNPRPAPAPGVLDAIRDADVLLVAPSNPVVSVAPVLAIDGVAHTVAGRPGPRVGVSPIIGGRVVRGMADRLLPVLGVAVDARAVGAAHAGLLDGWVMDEVDRDGDPEALRRAGMTASWTDTRLDDPVVAEACARHALALAERLR